MNRRIEQAMISPCLSEFADLDPRSAQPLYRQICDRFRRVVSGGMLSPGDRVPSARGLAKDLGLSRGTIEAAYSMLTAEGYLQARGQAGTVVAPGLLFHSVVPTPPVSVTPSPARRSPQGMDAIPPFQLGLPALDAFPRKTWARLGARCVRSMRPSDMMYPPPYGLDELRKEIAAYLQVSRGFPCTPSQVFITSGYRQTLHLVRQVFLQEGDPVWTEDPGYPVTRELLKHDRLDVVAVPVDEDGLSVLEGIRLSTHARAAVVTPAHQNPTCVSLSLSRRLALLDWAMKEKAWIVEDDYDGEYRYVGRPLPALKSLDRDGRVLYAGTFSKVLFPGIRLAYLVVPEDEVERFQRSAEVSFEGAATLYQSIVAAFIAEGHFARHIQRMRRLYGERREATTTGLTAVMRGLAHVVPRPGGMHLILQLAPHVNDVDLAGRMCAQGLDAHALTGRAQRVKPSPALLLSFANVDSEATAVSLATRIRELMI